MPVHEGPSDLFRGGDHCLLPRMRPVYSGQKSFPKGFRNRKFVIDDNTIVNHSHLGPELSHKILNILRDVISFLMMARFMGTRNLSSSVKSAGKSASKSPGRPTMTFFVFDIRGFPSAVDEQKSKLCPSLHFGRFGQAKSPQSLENLGINFLACFDSGCDKSRFRGTFSDSVVLSDLINPRHTA